MFWVAFKIDFSPASKLSLRPLLLLDYEGCPATMLVKAPKYYRLYKKLKALLQYLFSYFDLMKKTVIRV